MNKNELITWMQYIMQRSPAPDSGEATYAYLKEHMERLLAQDPDMRGVFIEALRTWLALRKEPESMSAAKLAAGLKLTELREDLHQLLVEIEGGQSKFNPHMKAYYARRVHNYLSDLYNVVPK
ncbi:MAG: hypothetical protein KF854_07610 [Nitrospira sp.]|nr:hypothetical protein [Nitrospira sp.]